MNKKYFLALDLKDDPASISGYIDHHKKVSAEIKKSITDAGVENMEIFNKGNRLFMIMEVGENFSFEKKAEMDKNNPKVQEWETLMSNYFQPLPGCKKEWTLLENIFSLHD